jgi:hypothetical protein
MAVGAGASVGVGMAAGAGAGGGAGADVGSPPVVGPWVGVAAGVAVATAGERSSCGDGALTPPLIASPSAGGKATAAPGGPELPVEPLLRPNDSRRRSAMRTPVRRRSLRLVSGGSAGSSDGVPAGGPSSSAWGSSAVSSGASAGSSAATAAIAPAASSASVRGSSSLPPGERAEVGGSTSMPSGVRWIFCEAAASPEGWDPAGAVDGGPPVSVGVPPGVRPLAERGLDLSLPGDLLDSGISLYSQANSNPAEGQ